MSIGKMSEDSQSIVARSDLLGGHAGSALVDPSFIHEPEGRLLEIPQIGSRWDW